jgi:hypothetical protein
MTSYIFPYQCNALGGKNICAPACEGECFHYISLEIDPQRGEKEMPTVKVNEAEIYYEEHGRGRPMAFLSETACDGEVWKIHQVFLRFWLR